MRFESPTTFLSYLKELQANPAPRGASDPDFASHLEQQAKVANLDNELANNNGLDTVIQNIVDSILLKLAPDIALKIQSGMAFGTLDIGTVNARICRSMDGHFAVIVHTGLMLFLSKATKLIYALKDPTQVIYCNRKDAQHLTQGDLKEYLDDLIKNTNTLNAPYGALIHLKPELSQARARTVHLMELFVVCHELGHYLNGDLQNDADFQVFEAIDAAQEYIENRNHGQERSGSTNLNS